MSEFPHSCKFVACGICGPKLANNSTQPYLSGIGVEAGYRDRIDQLQTELAAEREKPNPYIKRYDDMRAAWEHGVLVRADLERKLNEAVRARQRAEAALLDERALFAQTLESRQLAKNEKQDAKLHAVVGVVDLAESLRLERERANLAESALAPSTNESCGRHSGIPECCIAWFVTHKGEPRPDDPSAEYVRCPECMASNLVVELKSCPSPTACADARFREWAEPEMLKERERANALVAELNEVCDWDAPGMQRSKRAKDAIQRARAAEGK
jgi:hypothetical protein